MNLQRWNLVDWGQFDEFRGDTSRVSLTHEATFPYLLDCLESTDIATAKHGCAGIVQWPFESIEVMGRVGAVPTVIECICDMLRNGSSTFPEIAIDAVVGLREGVVHYSFFKRFFAGGRVSLWEEVSRVVESHFDLFCDLTNSREAAVRFHAATLLMSCDRQMVASFYRLRIDEETDHRIVSCMARVLGSVVDPDHRRILLNLLTDASHASIKLTAREALAQASHTVPNPWLRELCQDATRLCEPSLGVDDIGESALHAIESLPQDAWAYAVAFWMDRLDSLADHTIVDRMHCFLRTILRWHWNRGFSAYVNGEISWILQVTLGYLAQCDKYWDHASDSQAKDLEHLLNAQFGLPFERPNLRTHFGRFH